MKAKGEPKHAAAAPNAPAGDPKLADSALLPGAAWVQAATECVSDWQRQCDAGLRMMDAAARNLKCLQSPRSSATAWDRYSSLQQAMIEARSPFELWAAQCNWMVESASRTMTWWREVFDAAQSANADLLACLREMTEAGMPGAEKTLAAASVHAPVGTQATQDLVRTALVSFDAAYGQMIRNSQQMMAAAAEAFNTQMNLAAPPATKPVAKP